MQQTTKKMNHKIHIRICVGTYSYIMGGAELMNLQEEIPEQWKELVKVDAAVNLPGCDEKTMSPPFVEVNGVLMCEASKEKILQEIERLMNS